MPIYTKPVSQLIFADLEELLQANAVENIRLEFKLTTPAKDETLKKLSSFANTFGGLVVIGAHANSVDGRIQALAGVDPENGYKQRIMQWSFDEVSPPLIVEVSDPIPVPGSNTKVCYVISIAESDAAPHFLNGRKVFGFVLMNSALVSMPNSQTKTKFGTCWIKGDWSENDAPA